MILVLMNSTDEIDNLLIYFILFILLLLHSNVSIVVLFNLFVLKDKL